MKDRLACEGHQKATVPTLQAELLDERRVVHRGGTEYLQKLTALIPAHPLGEFLEPGTLFRGEKRHDPTRDPQVRELQEKFYRVVPVGQLLGEVRRERGCLLDHLDQHVQNPQGLHHPETRRGLGGLQDVSHQDVAHGLPRHVLEAVSVALHRCHHVRGDPQVVPEQELQDAKLPRRVVPEGLVGVHRGGNELLLQVLAPQPRQVDHLGLLRSVGEVQQPPQKCVERELPTENVLLDGRRGHIRGLVALPLATRPVVGLLAGVGDLDDLAQEVHPVQDPLPLHRENGHAVLVGGEIGLHRDGVRDLAGEPLGVVAPTQGHGVHHHVDVLDGHAEEEVADSTAYHVDVLCHTFCTGDPGQELHEGNGFGVVGHHHDITIERLGRGREPSWGSQNVN